MIDLPPKVNGYQATAINKIIDYCRAITIRPSYKMQITQGVNGTTISPIVKRAALSSSEYDRFRVEYENATTIKVKAGWYTCNGIKIEKSDTSITGVGEDVPSPTYAASFGDDTYYIYLEKYNDLISPVDASLEPSGVKIICCTDAALPSPLDSTQRHLRWLLGSFATVSGNITKSSIVNYWIGDIDEQTVVPDSNMVDPLDYPIQTTEFRAGDSQGQLQLYNAHSTSLANAKDWVTKQLTGIPGLPKNSNNGGDLTWYGIDSEDGTQQSIDVKLSGQFEIHNMPAADAGSFDTGVSSTVGFCFRTASSGEIRFANWNLIGANAATYLNDNSSLNHNDLNFVPSTTETAGYNADHDMAYLHAYDDNNYIGNKNFRTTGEWWSNSVHISADGSTDSQYWTAAALLANVTGAVSITGGTTATVDAATTVILGAMSGPPNINIFGDTTTVDGVTALYLSGPNIYYNTNAGLDTYGHTKGGFTDESAFEAGVGTVATEVVEMYL